MATALEERLRALAIAKLYSEQGADRFLSAQNALHTTQEWRVYQAELAAQRLLDDAVTMADALVRQEMMDYYLTTGDKKPTPGIEVQLRKKLVYDQRTVIEWLEVNAPKLIERKVAKGFDKVAETLGAPVTVDYEPFVKMATNLRGYLPSDLLVPIPEPEPEIETVVTE